MTSYIITSDAVLEAAGPYTECRFTCEVNVGTAEAPTWEPRAYRAVKPRIDERRVLVRSCDACAPATSWSSRPGTTPASGFDAWGSATW